MRSGRWFFWLGILLGSGLTQAQQPSKPATASSKAADKKQVTLAFPGEGERWWWLENLAGEPESVPSRVSDKKTAVEVALKKGFLWVLDPKSGNLARFHLDQIADTVEFKSDTWSHLARLRVEVKATGKPVAAAIVTLKDKEGKAQRRVIEPTALGTAEFERVALGRIKVEVRYGENQTASQEVDLSADRQERVPRIEMVLAANVPTVEPPTAQTAATPPSSGPLGGERGGFGTILNWILGLGILVVVLYIVLRFVAGHDERVGQFMQKLGVQLPQAQPAPTDGAPSETAQPPPVVPEGFCPFCGQKKDPLTSACACTLTPGTATPGRSAGAPRLVGLQGAYAGQVYELQGDLISIGREAGNTVVLSEDNTVSRRHAQIIRQDGNLVVQDLGSSNGTYVNGVRITTETLLRPGDTLQFGASVFKLETS